jgi:SAM-dependent methyltransferase
MQKAAKLQQLYNKTSKHSGYQILPSVLAPLVSTSGGAFKSRHESERLDFIRSVVSLENKRILDIGGNTGFFTFESIKYGAQGVVYYDGNADHAAFVRVAADLMKVDHLVSIRSEYFDFNTEQSPELFDVAFLLNVLHHVGDDYGNSAIDIAEAKRLMIRHLVRMAGIADTVVFQMGYCWKGNRDLPLFDRGIKEEMIQFVRDGIGNVFIITAIGIPERIHGEIVYRRPSNRNLKRNDGIGEFLNRPIFILSRKRI